MVLVTVWGSLRSSTDGQEKVEIDAKTFKGVLDALSRDYPALAPEIKRGVSLAIDGVIFKEAWFTPVKPDSEVVLLPYMQGG